MTALAVLGGVVGVAFLMGFSAIFNGYTLSVLWGWFVVPTFGAPALDVVPAIGIAPVVGDMTQQMREKKKDEQNFKQIIAHSTAYAIIKPSFALCAVGSCISSCS